jgi:hypothetical protein
MATRVQFFSNLFQVFQVHGLRIVARTRALRQLVHGITILLIFIRTLNASWTFNRLSIESIMRFFFPIMPNEVKNCFIISFLVEFYTWVWLSLTHIAACGIPRYCYCV